MTKILGRTVDIGIAKEASRGVAETAADYYLPKMNLTLDDIVTKALDANSVGVVEDSVDSKNVAKMAVGSFEGKIGADSIGLIMLAVFGTVSTAGPTDSAYTHTYSVQQDAQHDSLTLFYDDGNQDYRHALGMVTDFSLNVVLGAFATVSVGFRAKAGATGSNTPSYSAETAFLPQHGTFKIASAQSGLDAVGATNIKSIKLDIAKNVEDDMAIGSPEPVDILNKQFGIEGELELVFDDEAIKTAMLADTAKALRIELINTDVTIGAGTNPTVQIDLHSVKFSEFTRNIGNDDIVTATVRFKAHYSLTDAKMVTAKLINDVVSY